MIYSRIEFGEQPSAGAVRYEQLDHWGRVYFLATGGAPSGGEELFPLI